MITSWRIVKSQHQARAFDGEGAKLAGGRWNSPGVAMIYTAQSAALATLEMLVHLNSSPVLSSYVLIACAFPEAIVLRLDRGRLPVRWRAYPAVPQLQLLGDAWMKNGLSAVLEVPSVIIQSEANYLLNPAHPDFTSIEVRPAQPFDVDARLAKS